MGFKLEQTVVDKKEGLAFNQRMEILLQKEVTLFGGWLNARRKEDFYTQMGVLLKAGVHLRESLAIFTQNQKEGKRQSYFEAMLQELDKGRSLSEIVADRKEFSEYERYSIHIGEQSGTLAKVVEQLALFYKRKNDQGRNVRNALTYPVIILCTAILVVVFMLRMVVPMFEDIFRQNGVELPAITKGIIAASNFVKDYGTALLFAMFALWILKRFVLNGKEFERRKQKLYLKLPILGPFLKTFYLAQFTQAVALLTASKVPIVESIRMARRMIAFYPLQNSLERMEDRILKGVSLSDSFKGDTLFDSKMASLIKVAEETNQTEFIFERLNGQYATELEQKSKMIATLLEPFIIVAIGFFVGVILVAMYLPMFKLSSVLG
ncbi:type II secretion system F family protein [Flagellimonas sp. DF-77]|uniref:type II secretion system F family protein n=1 Tax=Flagellimonas algarum TaxID=3230298 RepID=UPI003395E386